VLDRDAREADGEAIRAQVAGPQLVRVASDGEHAHPLHLELARCGGLRMREADPLPRDRLLVLETRITGRCGIGPDHARQARDGFRCVELALFDPEIEVLAASARLVGGHLLDHEVVRRLLDGSCDGGDVTRERRKGGVHVEERAERRVEVEHRRYVDPTASIR
jgi:hypothetical protein